MRLKMMRRAVLVVGVAVPMLVLTGPASAHPGGPGTFSCRASAVRVTSPILNLEPVVANKDQVPCQTEPKQLASVPAAPVVVANVLTATTTSNPGGVASGNAESSVAGVNLLGGAVLASVLKSSALSGCAIENGNPVLVGSSSIATLVVNGKPVAVGSAPLTIPVNPLVTLYVNRQIIAGNTITQRALEVDSPALKTNIVVAESIADIESCGG